MTKLLIFILTIFLSPFIVVVLLFVSPFYFLYKIFDRILTYREIRKGHHAQPKNPLMSFAMPFLKDFMNPNKKPI